MLRIALARTVAVVLAVTICGEARAAPSTLPNLPAFPADRTIRQSATIAGHRIRYDVTVGSIKLRDDRGSVTGEVVFVAYTVPGQAAARRPVTFSFNGGPGAAQISLNFGAVGPKRLDTGTQGARPSDAPAVHDNPNSWLDFTDLVFIDPIGTGYSRTLLDEDATRKAFLGADADVHYLSEVVYKWLRANGRMASPKYLLGESYGGYRVPRIAEYLDTDLSIGVSGITMVSPALQPWPLLRSETTSPIKEMIYLPSEAAAHFEAEGQALTPSLMEPVERYARTQYLTDLYAGLADPAALARIASKVSELTGLNADDVRARNGWIADEFTRLRFHRENRIASSYDGNVSSPAPFPERRDGDYDDAILLDDAPREEAMVNLIDRQVGWKVDARYVANNYDLNGKFDHGKDPDAAVSDLRKALANDSNLRVLIAHGWTDLSCPYFGSRLVLDQMPRYLAQHVMLRIYPGGHMFYDRVNSAAAWRRDAMALYDRGLR